MRQSIFGLPNKLCADNEKQPRKLRLPGLFLSGKEINGREDLHRQNHRDTHGELGVLGLVPDSVHTQQAADAAAQSCHAHEGGFRDPPAMMPGFPLVNEHKQEAHRID